MALFRVWYLSGLEVPIAEVSVQLDCYVVLDSFLLSPLFFSCLLLLGIFHQGPRVSRQKCAYLIEYK